MLNCTDNSAESILQNWNHELALLWIPNDLILALYLIIGISGNCLILFVYEYRMKSGQDERYFIPVLAILDLLSCIINTGLAFSLNILPVRYPSDVLCKTLWFFGQSTSIASGVILLVMAIHRYMIVCKPLSPRWTLKRKRVAVTITVTVACIVSAPSLFYVGVNKTFHPKLNVTGFTCNQVQGIAMKSANVFIFVSGTASMITAAILYICIWRAISKKLLSVRTTKKASRLLSAYGTNNNTTDKNSVSMEMTTNNDTGEYQEETSHGNGTQNLDPSPQVNLKSSKHGISQRRLLQGRVQSPGAKRQIRHHRYSVMFLTLTIVFTISFLPKALMLLLESFLPEFWMKTGSTLAFILFMYQLYIINNVVNPFIYGFFDQKFRNKVKTLLCNCRGKQTVNERSKR